MFICMCAWSNSSFSVFIIFFDLFFCCRYSNLLVFAHRHTHKHIQMYTAKRVRHSIYIGIANNLFVYLNLLSTITNFICPKSPYLHTHTLARATTYTHIFIYKYVCMYFSINRLHVCIWNDYICNAFTWI